MITTAYIPPSNPLLPKQHLTYPLFQVWINNCVGQLNTRHFLAFLAATNLLLTYGIYLSFDIIQNSFILQALIPSQIPLSHLPWSVYLHLFGIAIVEEIYIGAVFLLSVLTGVLSYAFTLYHMYLPSSFCLSLPLADNPQLPDLGRDDHQRNHQVV